MRKIAVVVASRNRPKRPADHPIGECYDFKSKTMVMLVSAPKAALKQAIRSISTRAIYRMKHPVHEADSIGDKPAVSCEAICIITKPETSKTRLSSDLTLLGNHRTTRNWRTDFETSEIHPIDRPKKDSN